LLLSNWRGKKKVNLVHLAKDKQLIASSIGINLKNTYYTTTRRGMDLETKDQIESVLVSNPAYGHRRIAMDLRMNKKKILRVMHKFGIKPFRRKFKFFKKRDVNTKEISYINILKVLCPIRENIVWVSDFTYIKYRGRFIYLSSVQDFHTREVLGIGLSRFHDRHLVEEALRKGEQRAGMSAKYIHSDQGSEYRSFSYKALARELGITISMSDKGSPWQNGQMESFFGRFKEEAGDINRFESLPELIEYIYQQVYYYNNKRIHTTLKMAPVQFKQKARRKDS